MLLKAPGQKFRLRTAPENKDEKDHLSLAERRLLCVEYKLAVVYFNQRLGAAHFKH